MQFDEKSSSFEAELAYLGPRESVDANQVLKDEDSEVSDWQMKSRTIVILPNVNHTYTLLHDKSYLEQTDLQIESTVLLLQSLPHTCIYV